MTKDMTAGNPLALILKFALPLLAGNLLQQGYNLADAAIVGRFLGTKALACVGSSGSVQFLVLGFCIGTCTGFAVPMAQRFGAGDYDSLRRFVYNSFLLTAGLAVVLTVVCALLCEQIIRVLSTPQDIFAGSCLYLFITFLGIPFTLLYNLTSSMMRAVGDSRTPFLVLAFSTVTNIFLDVFCITVLRWGVAGAALATITSQGMSGTICLFYIIKKYPALRLDKEVCQISAGHMKTLTVMGVPMGLQFSITAVGSMVLQSANNHLGSVYVSAYTASSRLKLFAMCPFDALAAAVSTFCGQNYGAGKVDRIKEGVWKGTAVSVGYGFFVGALLIFFGREMTLLFVSGRETEVIYASAKLLYYAGFFYWSLGILIMLRLCVQGLGFSGRAVFCGVVEMIARIAVSLLFVPSWGFLAICFADQAAWVLAVVYILPTCVCCVKRVERECSSQR